MRTGQNFGLLYCMMLICQIVLSTYSPVGPYITLTVLPAMILCIPMSVSTLTCMIIAFASGLCVDWLSEGLIGINAAAIVPVALARRSIVKIFFGEDLISRGDSFSFNKFGVAKVSAAILVSLAIFLLIYISLDGAGTRETWFNLTYFGLSLLCSWLISLIATNILTPDDRK